MKKLMMILALVLVVPMSFGQEEKKDTYILNGDHIEATLYHDNGIVAQTGTYDLKNRLDGQWISYDAEGNKTGVAQYKNGLKVGTWMFFDGDILREVTYSSSKIAKVKTYTVTDTRVVSN